MTEPRATIVVEWLYEYRKMFGPLHDSHPVEILIDSFRAQHLDK